MDYVLEIILKICGTAVAVALSVVAVVAFASLTQALWQEMGTNGRK